MPSEIIKYSGETPEQLEPSALGMNLDFSHGRGFLAAGEKRLADWLTLNELRMEIPDLSFPFDASQGVFKFKDRRCRLHRAELTIFSEAFERLLQRAVGRLESFDHFSLHFVDGAIHLMVRLKENSGGVFLSAKAFPVQPTLETGDRIHLSFYDYQAYGPIEEPARRILVRLITEIMETDLFSPPGRGESFTVSVAGDILSFRLLKLLSLGIFPKLGWKLPDLSEIRIEEIEISPGRLRFKAVSDGEETRPEPVDEIHSREQKRALAAYEAKELFSTGDEYLYEGRIDEALRQYEKYQRTYGLHPELVSRRLDCLLVRSQSDAMIEIESICRQLGEEHPVALRTRMNLAASKGDATEQVEYGKQLLDVLDQKDRQGEKMLVLFTLADVLRENRPERAAEYLTEILDIAPRSQLALQMLRRIYVDLEAHEKLEAVLMQLTQVLGESRELIEAYIRLAEHLMEHEGQLGVSEAIEYLKQALGIDSSIPEIHERLGEAFLKADNPARARQSYETGARIHESNGDEFEAAMLEIEIAGIWVGEFDNYEQASLHCKKAMNRVDFSKMTTDQLRRVAPALYLSGDIAEQNDEPGKAVNCWSQLMEVGRTLARSSTGFESVGRSIYDQDIAFENAEQLLEDVHKRIGQLQYRRQRYGAAARHLRQVLRENPRDEETFGALEQIYRERGDADKLIDLLEFRIEHADSGQLKQQTTRKVIDLLEALGRSERANDYREKLKTFGEIEHVEPETDVLDVDPSEISKQPSGEDESGESKADDLEAFRQKYDQLVNQRDTDFEEADEDTSESDPTRTSDAESPEDSDGATGQNEQPIEGDNDLLDRLQQARNADESAETRVQLLREVVETYEESPDDIDIDDNTFARYNYELGELLYYELEKSSKAKPYFEKARDIDPEGMGRDSTLLTTLERIYEEESDMRSRLEILEDQLEAADSREMKQTYRVLLAQACWNELEDADASREWLERVLEENPKHEGAHRLLADIARHEEDYEGLAEHLRTVLEASSGLDAVELERELGEVSLRHLDDLEAAVEHLEHVLEESPADSNAFDLLKEAYMRLGDWNSYFECLDEEIRLLIGPFEGRLSNETAVRQLDIESEELKPAAVEIMSDAAFIAQSEMDKPELAHCLWTKVTELTPEQVEALQKRIGLARQLNRYEDLANALETVGELLLEPENRKEKFEEAAQIWVEKLQNKTEAERLRQRAQNMGEPDEQIPDDKQASQPFSPEEDEE